MLKYILFILILVILFWHYQLVVADSASNNNNTDLFKKTAHSKEITVNKNNSCNDNKNNIFLTFFSWITKGTTEIDSWEFYKKTFISNDGRVMDPLRASITTSEGQAYAMARALMMHDKKTFDKTYNWAKYNLQHENDNLFAWLWGQKNPGEQKEIEYEILDQNGATDAGTEIAVSLIYGYKIWNQKEYMKDAIKILNDIWNLETVEIKGERIITAGMKQNKMQNIEINPSYFMPASYRIFAKVDKNHDWNKLIDSSYRLTNYCIDYIPSGLPPDAFYINRDTGEIIFDKDKSDFSYDAVRSFYRFYVDHALYDEPRAEKLLSRSKIFINRWKCEKKFYTCIKQNGEPKDYSEAIGSIAIILPTIKMYDPKIADNIYQSRIRAKYNRKGYWNDPMDYYAQNLVWFGNWLYLNEENIKTFKY